MERRDPSLPDWRDTAAYQPLLGADRAILAWEWLRRVPAYSQAAAQADESASRHPAERWGLHCFEDPARAAPLARPMWTATVLSPVLFVSADPDPDLSSPDLAALSRYLTLQAGEAAEHVLLTDGQRLLRLDVVEGTVRKGRARLRFQVDGPPALSASLLALRRFDALVRRGKFARALHPPEPRADRLVRVLRAADALAAGARQRDIAAHLLGIDVGRPGWREDRPSARLQAQRLVRDARSHLSGGYLGLLKPEARKGRGTSPKDGK